MDSADYEKLGYNFADLSTYQLKSLACQLGISVDTYHGTQPLKADFVWYIEQHYARARYDEGRQDWEHLDPFFTTAGRTKAYIRQLLTSHGIRYFDNATTLLDGKLPALQKLFADKVDEMRTQVGYKASVDPSLSRQMRDIAMSFNGISVEDTAPQAARHTRSFHTIPPPPAPTDVPHTARLARVFATPSRNVTTPLPVAEASIFATPPRSVPSPQSSSPFQGHASRQVSPIPSIEQYRPASTFGAASGILRSTPAQHAGVVTSISTAQASSPARTPAASAARAKLERNLKRTVEWMIEQIHLDNLVRAVNLLIELREDIEAELSASVVANNSHPREGQPSPRLGKKQKSRLCDAVEDMGTIVHVRIQQGRLAEALRACNRVQERLEHKL